MKGKPIVHRLTLWIALGTVALLVGQSAADTPEGLWETWVDEQTDTVLKSAGDIDEASRAEMHTRIRAKFSALAAELKNEVASPPQTQDYVILQTVKELRNVYDEDYDRRHENTTVRVSYTIGDTEVFAYDENIPLAKIDAKYPRDTWLQMLLDKGIKIENAAAYWEYMSMRVTLVHIEKQPQVWTSGLFGIPSTEDWDTYKTAYIEKELGRIQKHLKKDRHRWIFSHNQEDYHSLLEKNTDKKVFQELPNFSKSLPINVFKVPQTVKGLRKAYDEKYNERYAHTSGSFSIKRDDGPVFTYQFPLLLSEVDAKYPRDTWLQMLLDAEITIDNFEEYWAYLSQRDTLVELEKQEAIWSSGFFDIPPTDDWETYKAAYLQQMVKKLHQKGHDIRHYVDIDHFNKAKIEAETIDKRIRKQFQRPLNDR